MAVFNQLFFDLNNKRGYCLHRPDAAFPLELISDLKISLPDQGITPVFRSIFVQDTCVRIIFALGAKIILSFTSDDREFVRIGQAYALKSHAEGYEGIIVFGAGIRHDHRFDGEAEVSEECLTRYVPSRIPYVSLTCIQERLTGEVRLGGSDLALVRTDKTDVPGTIFPGIDQAVRIDLVDTFRVDSQNPMIRFANGINSYNEVSQRSPVYTIGGVHPNASGTVIMQFEDHFSITGVVRELPDTEGEGEEPPAIIAVAVCSDIVQNDVCSPSQEEPQNEEEEQPDDTCDVKEIPVETIAYT
jgi:hypothetical protein